MDAWFDKGPHSPATQADIFQKPFSEYEGVTPIPDFTNETNLTQARARSPNPRLRDASIELFNRGIAQDADMKRRLERFR